MKYLKYLVITTLLLMLQKNNLLCQYNFKKWSINITPSINAKGKTIPDSLNGLSMKNYNSLSFQFGINYSIFFKKHSYLSIGYQHGWTTFKFLPDPITTQKYPELLFDDLYPMKMKSGLGYRYNMLTISYNIKLLNFNANELYIGAGVAFRKNIDIYSSYSYTSRDTSNLPIIEFQLNTNNQSSTSLEFTLAIIDKIKIKNTTRFLVGLDFHYCPIYSVYGRYVYLPTTRVGYTGSYFVSGSYLGLTLGYFFNFNKD
jgi:hypothetical protein